MRSHFAPVRLFFISAMTLVAGCSAQIVELNAPMSVSELGTGEYQLEQEVSLKAKNASPLTLRPGTTWHQIGTIEQGRVFDTRDQVLIVNSFNVYEAAIVTHQQTVIGYYLKGTGAFVAVNPVPIQLNKLE